MAQGDSLLVVNQVTGRWQVKHAGLAPYHAAARQLAMLSYRTPASFTEKFGRGAKARGGGWLGSWLG